MTQPIRSMRDAFKCTSAVVAFIAALTALTMSTTLYGNEPHAVERDYHAAPPSPQSQSEADVETKSGGCRSCHTTTDRASMHRAPQ